MTVRIERDTAGKAVRFPADIEVLGLLQRQLSADDFIKLGFQISRAAAAKRPSELQRLLLAIVAFKGEIADDLP